MMLSGETQQCLPAGPLVRRTMMLSWDGSLTEMRGRLPLKWIDRCKRCGYETQGEHTYRHY